MFIYWTVSSPVPLLPAAWPSLSESDEMLTPGIFQEGPHTGTPGIGRGWTWKCCPETQSVCGSVNHRLLFYLFTLCIFFASIWAFLICVGIWRPQEERSTVWGITVRWWVWLSLERGESTQISEITSFVLYLGFPGCSDSKAALQEVWLWSLGGEYPLEKGMATHSSIPA